MCFDAEVLRCHFPGTPVPMKMLPRLFLPVSVAIVATGLAGTTWAAEPSAYLGRPFGDAQHPAKAQSIPGRVLCAYYDEGGEGVAYHDTDAINSGSGKLNPADGSYLNEFRKAEAVDISYVKRLNDLEHGCNLHEPPEGLHYVGWTEPGEWFNLTVMVESAGAYDLSILYTSQRGAEIAVECRGAPLTGTVALASTFDAKETIPWRQWHHWAMHTGAVVRLPAGVSVLKVRVVSGGNMNLGWLEFTPRG